MSYAQVKKFDPSKGGNIANMCLANVIKGYGITPKYLTAWTAWQHTQQHTDAGPTNVDLPVFFSYTATIDGINQNWGHIGVRLADGRFWSDGNYYPSIAAYTSTHYPKYVGWGESINDVTVIKEETVPMFNEGDRVNFNVSVYGSDKGYHKDEVGKVYKDAIYAIFNSKDYLNYVRVNDGDVKNFNGVVKVGKFWKDTAYQDLNPLTGSFKPVTTQLYEKG